MATLEPKDEGQFLSDPQHSAVSMDHAPIFVDEKEAFEYLGGLLQESGFLQALERTLDYLLKKSRIPSSLIDTGDLLHDVYLRFVSWAIQQTTMTREDARKYLRAKIRSLIVDVARRQKIVTKFRVAKGRERAPVLISETAEKLDAIQVDEILWSLQAKLMNGPGILMLAMTKRGETKRTIYRTLREGARLRGERPYGRRRFDRDWKEFEDTVREHFSGE